MEERIYVDLGLSAGMRLAKLKLGLPEAKKEIKLLFSLISIFGK